jgi:hypothetical protein
LKSHAQTLDKKRIFEKNRDMTATIHIDDRLFLQAQELAQATGCTVDAFIAQALEESLQKQQRAVAEKKYSFTRDRGMGLRRGVEISNNAELLDIMEEGLDVSHRR